MIWPSGIAFACQTVADAVQYAFLSHYERFFRNISVFGFTNKSGNTVGYHLSPLSPWYQQVR